MEGLAQCPGTMEGYGGGFLYVSLTPFRSQDDTSHSCTHETVNSRQTFVTTGLAPWTQNSKCRPLKWLLKGQQVLFGRNHRTSNDIFEVQFSTSSKWDDSNLTSVLISAAGTRDITEVQKKFYSNSKRCSPKYSFKMCLVRGIPQSPLLTTHHCPDICNSAPFRAAQDEHKMRLPERYIGIASFWLPTWLCNNC